MWYDGNITEPLLDRGPDLLPRLALPICVTLSAVAMHVLKWGERTSDARILTLGFLLEGGTFAMYSLSMRAYPLRVITVCWSGGSVVSAVAGGALLYGEAPSPLSVVGCAVVLLGIVVAVH